MVRDGNEVMLGPSFKSYRGYLKNYTIVLWADHSEDLIHLNIFLEKIMSNEEHHLPSILYIKPEDQ